MYIYVLYTPSTFLGSIVFYALVFLSNTRSIPISNSVSITISVSVSVTVRVTMSNV